MVFKILKPEKRGLYHCDVCHCKEGLEECFFPYSSSQRSSGVFYDLCTRCRETAACLQPMFMNKKSDVSLASLFRSGMPNENIKTATRLR